MKVLIVYKKSFYEDRALDRKDRNFLRLLREESAATRRSKGMHDVHMETLKSIRKHLRTLKIPFDVRHRYDLEPIEGYGLVISIGGDGTFLETSHFVKKGFILGVNSVPQESVGYFCRATAKTFPRKITDFIGGRAKIQPLHRLRLSINGKEHRTLALNDILFASPNPAAMTRYIIKLRGVSEEHKSSGIWFSPAPGSTAATRSAGGKIIPLSSKNFQYVVREPYAPPGRNFHLLKGILKPHEHVEVMSMMDDAAAYIDGPHCVVPIPRGSLMRICKAHDSIQAVF